MTQRYYQQKSNQSLQIYIQESQQSIICAIDIYCSTKLYLKTQFGNVAGPNVIKRALQIKFKQFQLQINQYQLSMSRDIGQYKIFNEIGKGSFGKVYKGVDKLTNEEVALKFIQKKQKRSRDLKNLRQQNQLLKKINHPNVICLKDVIQTPKEIIIVTDYAGRDLSGVIEEKKKFPLDKVKDYSTQILNAMLYLNENRIIHRDLKPQNILIKNNHIKICDFGFAKKLSASTNFLQSMKGTPLYLAPQIVRQTKYTQKVDVWSFGCIIYELFTGRTPYYANTYQRLAPLILYQQVQYPKDMPSDLKDLICSMLQKNPSVRASWAQLKEHSFFRQSDALKQKIQNQLREVVSIQIPDKIHFQKVQSNKQNYEFQQKQAQQAHIIESKVIQKLDNQNEIKGYGKDFKKIYDQLLANNTFGNQLKKDIIFLHKIKTVFHQRSQLNPLISNQLLETIFNILSQLIKNKKNLIKEIHNENNAVDEDDITQNQTLIIGILCIAKVQKNYQMLEKQLKTIGYLIKRNFNGISINAQIDEEITEFVAEILLQNNSQLPIECVRNGLIIIGILVNQAFMTINNSFAYFERVAEDNLIGKIANIFKKQEKNAIVLECLKQFIHPTRDIPSMNGKNPNNVLHPRMINVFKNLKQQAAQSLLKTDFISEKSPLQVYSERSSHLVDYCQILLECLIVSKQARHQFLKHNYWSSLLSNNKIKAFVFAYNQILVKEQNKGIIPNQSMSSFTVENQDNTLTKVLILEIGWDKLKNKKYKNEVRASNKSLAQYENTILKKIKQLLQIDESLKLKYCREIYGALQTTANRYDEPCISIFYDIVETFKHLQSSQTNKQLCQTIFKFICATNIPFRPNCRSLLNLISLFTENQIISSLKTQNSIILFFYECLSDFIKREQFEYLEMSFDEQKIPAFLAKFSQCINWLIQVEDQNKESMKLSQNCLSLCKQIQNSCFYRFMFIDDLTEEQFFQHLRYSYKIVSKTSQIQAEFINFLGVKVVPMCRNYLSSKNQKLLIEILSFISLILRQHIQFNKQILGTQMVKRFKEWLTEDAYSESIKQKVLYLIGNMAKKSQFFFGEFSSYSVMDSITYCLKKNYQNTRIFKNTIYSVGNISFYTQKFYEQIVPMVPYFARTFQMNDNYLRNNLISTVSNLLRFSNIYLPVLIQTGMIENILKIACDAQTRTQGEPKQNEQVLNLVLSVLKKILPYEQFYRQFGYRELQTIYQKRNLFGGQTNQVIKKISQILQKANLIV